MTTAAQRIAGIAEQARESGLAAEDAIEQLAAAAQARGGIDGRRGDGAFFTGDDVARHLARRAIAGVLLDAARARDPDALLASGGDLREAVAGAAEDPAGRHAIVARLRSLIVLDPTCGAGAFLHAAWCELLAFEALLGEQGLARLDQLHGVDLDVDAVAACRATLDIARAGCRTEPQIRAGNAELAGQLPAADIVLGNPPYVRAAAGAEHAELRTASVPNRSAWIVERALGVLLPGGRTGFVLPVSTVCTDAFEPARMAWDTACDRVHATHFDTIPATLFPGVVQRVTFLEGRRRAAARPQRPARWWTSRYHRWLGQERETLLDEVRHVPMPPQRVGGSLPKVGSDVETRLLARLFEHPPAGRHIAPAGSAPDNRIHYKRRWSYFLLFTDFVPGIWNGDGSERAPSELKAIDVAESLDASVLLAVYSSSLFWWYFSVFTDNRNVNRRDLAAFPLPDLEPGAAARLATLGRELMSALRACAEVRTCTYRSVGTIRNTYFRQGVTRPVLDRIDIELAGAYGMPDEELAFVLGFERRFRS